MATGETSKVKPIPEEAPAPDEVFSGKTMPQVTTGPPTTTLTRRPWTVLITLGVSLACTIVLAVVNALGRYTTAETTLSKLVGALNDADVGRLLDDPELGFHDKAERDMQQRGLEEYNQILSAFGACSTAGLEQYRKLKQTVLLRGEEAFKKLTADEQRTIKQESKQVWLYGAGLESLEKESAHGVEDADVLTDSLKAADHTLRLGLEALASQGETEIPTLEQALSWKKPKPAQKALIARARMAGEAVLETLRKDANTAGLKKWKTLSLREKRNISQASYKAWVVAKGVELLDEQDRDLVGSASMFLDTADEEEEARKLCLLILSPSQKALIEGRSYQDFLAKREDYIRSTGRERYERFLKTLFGTCSYEITSSSVDGDDPYDLFRISKARFDVSWKGCRGAEGFLGEVLTFRYANGRWHYEAPAAAQQPAPPAAPAPGPPPAAPLQGVTP